VGEVYPDVLEDADSKFKSEESCDEERAVSEPQDTATNILAGQIVFSYISNLLVRKELKIHTAAFNSETCTVRSRFIENIANRIQNSVK